MSAYDSLSIFPDVGPALESLADQVGITPVIFTNGTLEMVSKSVNHSPDLSPVFEDLQRYRHCRGSQKVQAPSGGLFPPGNKDGEIKGTDGRNVAGQWEPV